MTNYKPRKLLQLMAETCRSIGPARIMDNIFANFAGPLRTACICPVSIIDKNMKHHTPVIISLLLVALCAPKVSAASPDSLWLDMRTSFHQQLEEETYSSQFKGEFMNLHVRGHLSDNIEYCIRQRFSKKLFDENNMFNATDKMYLNWNINEKWSLLAGKNSILFGGYEYEATTIDLYYVSLFCQNLPQSYGFGVAATYNFNDFQSLTLQVCNSPLSLGSSSLYAYNLMWNGAVASWWNTIWSLNLVEDYRNREIAYLCLGNRFVFGHVTWEFDTMSRSGIGQDNCLLADMSLISKLEWNVGNWNIFTKTGYEWNNSDNVTWDKIPFDIVITPGTAYFYTGFGAEWFPLGSDRLRLHAVYHRDNLLPRHNLELGVTWRINAFKTGV